MMKYLVNHDNDVSGWLFSCTDDYTNNNIISGVHYVVHDHNITAADVHFSNYLNVAMYQIL